MNNAELTCRAPLATSDSMLESSHRPRWNGGRAARAWAWSVTMGMAAMLSGCVSVNAPDKPIVIELNINIKQEVVYRLSNDAGQTIQNNKGIF